MPACIRSVCAEATVHVKELGTLLTVKVLENTPAVLSLGKLCDENGTNGSMVKNHISSKTGFGYPCRVHPLDLHRPERHLQNRRVILHHLLRFENGKMGLTVTPLQCKCQLRLMKDQGNLMKTTIGNPFESSQIPEWLQEFRENLVDDEIPAHGDSRSFCRAHIPET